MLENNVFHQEWIKVQKSLWGIAANSMSGNTSPELSLVDRRNLGTFSDWLEEVDTFWHEFANVSSTEVESVYQKASDCSHLFFTFSQLVSSMCDDKTTAGSVTEALKNWSLKSGTETKALDPESDIIKFWQLSVQSALGNVPNPLLNFNENINNSFAENPSFKKYLKALQDYQFALLKIIQKSTIETLEQLNSNQLDELSSQDVMATWLDLLEKQYEVMISSSDYSRLYAAVVNSWMLVLLESGQTYGEFVEGNEK